MTVVWLLIVLTSMSRTCQDVIRALEMSWKNVGELCSYNTVSVLELTVAKGGEETQAKGQQKGAVFTLNINQESGAERGEVQASQPAPPLRHSVDAAVPSPATPTLGDKAMVNSLVSCSSGNPSRQPHHKD